MRELKFRIVSAKGKILGYEWVSQPTGVWANELPSDIALDKKAKVATMPWKRDQFTGLKDRHGKEIYEGDIVRYTQGGHRKGEPKIVAKIGFENGTFCFDDLGLPFMSSVKTHGVTGEKMIEVIGNIHENPELLEVKDD